MLRDEGGARPEGAVSDNRILRIGIDVEDRREVHINSDRRQLLRHRLRAAISQIDRIASAERLCGRKLSERRSQPRDPSPLLIDGDKEGGVGGRLLKRFGQLGTLHRIFDVPREEDDAADMVFPDQLLDPLGRGGSLKPHHHELADLMGYFHHRSPGMRSLLGFRTSSVWRGRRLINDVGRASHAGSMISEKSKKGGARYGAPTFFSAVWRGSSDIGPKGEGRSRSIPSEHTAAAALRSRRFPQCRDEPRGSRQRTALKTRPP